MEKLDLSFDKQIPLFEAKSLNEITVTLPKEIWIALQEEYHHEILIKCGVTYALHQINDFRVQITNKGTYRYVICTKALKNSDIMELILYGRLP